MRAEGRAVLDAAGIAYASDEEQAGYRRLLKTGTPVDRGERPGGSSWQSLTRQSGNVEADYLNGEIVLLGRLHGVPTPVNEALQRLVKISARERRRPGAVSLTDLIARIDAG